MLFHGLGIHVVVIQVRWSRRGPLHQGWWHSTLAGWLVSCLLRSRSRRRPAWCLSLTRLTRLWRSSLEEPFLRLLLDLSTSIGPLKVKSPGPLSRAGGRLSPSIVGPISGSPGEPVHFLEGPAVAISLGRMCSMAWHWWLAWAAQSLDPDSFLPEGRRAFGHLGPRALRGSGLPAFPTFFLFGVSSS